MSSSSNQPAPEPSSISLRRVAWIAAAIVVIAFVAGLIPRIYNRLAIARETQEEAVPLVNVTSPAATHVDAGVPLPADVMPFYDAPIYARASGYLKRWLVDIGAHVEAGQLLAEIETPELDQQLAQARSELEQNEANLELSRTTSKRWAEMVKSSVVSQQENEEKQSDFQFKKAVVDASRANVQRLEALKNFSRITAPFAGTVTARAVDVGQLVTADGAHELFHLAQTNPLRVYVRVPQTLAQGIAIGQTASLMLQENPGKTYDATITQTAGAIDPVSRTMLVQLQADNAAGEILAGSYAQVRFNTNTNLPPMLTLPNNTLLFRAEGLQVAVVSTDGKVALHPVRVGRDNGKMVEILSGVAPADRVIINPTDGLDNGDTVRIATPEAPKK